MVSLLTKKIFQEGLTTTKKISANFFPERFAFIDEVDLEGGNSDYKFFEKMERGIDEKILPKNRGAMKGGFKRRIR